MSGQKKNIYTNCLNTMTKVLTSYNTEYDQDILFLFSKIYLYFGRGTDPLYSMTYPVFTHITTL